MPDCGADPLRYWDSCTFLAHLNDEPEADDCQGVMDAAADGQTRIVTSAFTLAEVVKVKHEKPIPIERSEEITRFFEHSYIVVRSVTRRTAELARELVWTHGITPKDAVHVATALHTPGVRLFETKDGPLLARSPLQTEGSAPLYFAKPLWPQSKLPLDDDPSEP